MRDSRSTIDTPALRPPTRSPAALELPSADAAEILGGIVALSSDAVISLDEAQRITLFNRAAQEIFGYDAAEVLGAPVDLLLPARFAERHRAEHVPDFSDAPVAARRMGERREVYGRRRNGEEFPAEVAISKSTLGGRVRYTAVLRDVTDRRRQEEALRASELRWRTLVDTAHDGVFVCDDDDCFVFVNSAFEAMCGRAARELLGRRVADVVAPDDLAAAPLRRAQLAGAGGRLASERTLVRPDGTRVHVEVGVTALPHGEVQCVVHDVTARRRVEEELRERERRFHGIFDSTFQFVGLLAPDGTLLEANRTALEFVGARAADVVGRPFPDTPWWAHSAAARARLREAIADAAAGAFVRYETEHVGLGGRAITLDFSLKPVRDADGTVVLLIPEGRDVTEARELAARLRASEATFRSAFAHSGIGMALVGLDGRWRQVNRALCEIVGYDEPALLEMTFQQVTHPDDLDADLRLVRELLAGTRTWYQLEKRYVRRDGQVVWILLNASLVRDDGTPSFFVAQIQDITARRESEAALARQAAELARSNAELEQFAYVASHDLQEPLRAVASYTQLLAERYEGRLDERADKWIRYAVDGAHQMQALIGDLLALSRVGTHVRPVAPTPLGAVLADTLRALAPAIEECGAVVTAGPLPTVVGDAVQLRQLVQNLIGNALKFRRPDAPPRVHVSSAADGGAWVVTVRDHGIGIDPRFAERIFVIFRRLHTREEYPGTGMGLAICRKIVERHGGRIWVEPAEGGGSAFRFTLPRGATGADAMDAGSPAEHAAPPASGNERDGGGRR